jgi:hypothetical protein
LTGYSQIPQQDTTLIIPSEVEVIVDDAFINLATTNPNITTIVFGNNQRLEIRENAFGNNPYITNVRADQANVEYLAASAFIGSPW